jgi:hypothetical protein
MGVLRVKQFEHLKWGVSGVVLVDSMDGGRGCGWVQGEGVGGWSSHVLMVGKWWSLRSAQLGYRNTIIGHRGRRCRWCRTSCCINLQSIPSSSSHNPSTPPLYSISRTRSHTTLFRVDHTQHIWAQKPASLGSSYQFRFLVMVK